MRAFRETCRWARRFPVPSTLRPSGRSVASGLLLLLPGAVVLSCGDATSEPPLTPDFWIALAPPDLEVRPGKAASVTVSVTGRNGFSGDVRVTVSGLPEGASVAPPSPFSVATGSSVEARLTIPGPTLPADFSLTFTGAVDTVRREFGYTLRVVPDVRTFRSEGTVYLERVQEPDTVRVGLYLPWGGTITELSLNRTNFVNAYDTGREIQIALYDALGPYDSCAGCSGNWGWNPVQGGDRWVHGSNVLEERVTDDLLYVRVRALEWYPDNKGGGPGQGVESDVVIEQWITSVPRHPRAFRAHYRIEHIGEDDHGLGGHEFPAIYANLEYSRFVHYAGAAPWSGGPVTVSTLPTLGEQDGAPSRYAGEHWGALVNEAGVGLTVFHPTGYPWMSGFTAPGTPGSTGFGTNYLHDTTPFAIGPGTVYEDEFYVIAGGYEVARASVYDLWFSGLVNRSDPLPPFGSLDSPGASEEVSGTVVVAGWFIDNVAVTDVEISVDGVPVGSATYGLERLDVAEAYPGASPFTGYEYELDSTGLSNGPHMIAAIASDGAGNRAPLTVSVLVVN